MRWLTLLSMLSLILSGCWGLPAALGGQAQSTFDSESEGWSVTGDVHGMEWKSDFGNPPGSLFAIDDVAGYTWYFVAPAKFLGNKMSAYGTALSYDIHISTRDSSPWGAPDVVLVGAGMTLNWFGPAPPAATWTDYDIALSETAGWLKSDSTPPSSGEMQAVLGDLTQLHIRAEYRTGDDRAYLDNVRLVPEPSTFILLTMGTLALLAYAWRKRRCR